MLLTDDRMRKCWITLFDLSMQLEQDSTAYERVRATMEVISSITLKDGYIQISQYDKVDEEQKG